MPTPRKKVNLILRESFEYGNLGRILTWALSVGRIIVIVTELIVIVAFVSRFWLDRTLTDLNEKNVSLRRQVEASALVEEDFRSAQERLESYRKIATKVGWAEHTRGTASLLPNGVTLTKVTFTKNELNLSGISLSEEGLAGFLKALRESGDFENLNLVNLSLATEGRQGLVFVVKGGVKDGNSR